MNNHGSLLQLANRKMHPAFFPAILSLCLIVGVISNVVSPEIGAIIITAAVTITVGRTLSNRLDAMDHRGVLLIIGAGMLLMLLIQGYIASKMPVSVLHDPYRILAQADQIAAGHLGWTSTYFWRYPNSVPLTYFLSLWLRGTLALGMNTNVSIHLLSILILDGFITLLLRTVWQLSKRNSVLLASFTFCVLTPFAYTYYLQVFYTDLPTMLILLVIMRILLHWRSGSRRYHVLAGCGLLLITTLGAILKPNMVVILPALAIIAALLMHKRLLKQSRLLLPMLLIAVGFALNSPANQVIYRATDYHMNTTYQMPINHWLYMGLNAKQFGMYSQTDVQRENQLPNKAARQQRNNHAIPHRMRKLGVFGIIRLWFTKLGILMNARDIGRWYNYSYRAAPAWYQAHSGYYAALIRIAYCTAMIVLFLSLIPRLLHWHPNLTDQRQVIALTAVITALGYLAFHTLLWETEPRYGQAILPLMWMVLSILPLPARKSGKLRVKTPVLVAAPLATALLLALPMGAVPVPNTVVAAQRSQLSAQYDAEPLLINPDENMHQDVNLNHHADCATVEIHHRTVVKVTLTNLKTGQKYRLHVFGYLYRTRQHLPAGRYRITVRNTTRRLELIDIVRTANYKLADHPLYVNGKARPTESFLYTFVVNEKQ